MRYISGPIFIMLYLIWTIKSIKELHKHNWKLEPYSQVEASAQIWFFFTALIGGTGFLLITALFW
jgi:hypothetical protein